MHKKFSFLIFFTSYYLLVLCLFFIFKCYIVAPIEATSYPKIWNVPLRNEYYVKRETLIKKIENSFQEGKNILTLTGMTGMGKTQLVKEYAHLSYKKYEIIWWLDALKDLESQFKEFSIAWNRKIQGDSIPVDQLSGKALVNYVKDKLRTTSIKWLLIFDNASHKDVINEYLPETHGKSSAHILITSRDPTTWHHTLLVKKLERSESIELFQKIVNYRAERESVSILAEFLGDYPLALSQAAVYFKACPSLTVQNYIKLFQTAYKKIWEDESKLIAQYGESLMEYQYTAPIALKLAISEILKESQEAYDLLLFTSFLAPNQIPYAFLEEYIAMSKAHGSPARIISILEKRLFLNRDDMQASQNPSYGIHETFQFVIRDCLDEKQKDTLFTYASQSFLSLLDCRLTKDKRINWEEAFQHVKKFLDLAEREESKGIDLLKLRILFLDYLLGYKRDLKEGKKQLDIAERLLKSASFNDSFYWALYHINKGNFLVWENADYTLALEHQQKALDLLKNIKQDGDQRLRVLTQLAQYSLLQGDTDRAQTYLEQGKDLEKRAQDFSMRALYHYGKSLYFLFNGGYENGLEHTEIALNLMSNGLPCPSITFSLESLRAELLLKQGSLKEAQKQSKDTFKKAEFYFQDQTNIFCLRVMIVMAGSALYNKKEAHKALTLFKRALSTLEDLSKSASCKHRQHGWAYVLLGDYYVSKKDWNNAYESYKMAEDIYDSVYKNKKVDDYSELYTKLALFGIKIKDDGITHKYLKNQVSIFGLSHLKTKEILRYMDVERVSIY